MTEPDPSNARSTMRWSDPLKVLAICDHKRLYRMPPVRGDCWFFSALFIDPA
jgi:hypothetical protein